MNLLAANTHDSASWSSGSGIFTPSGHAAYYHDLSPSSGGKLLVADLPIKPAKREVEWGSYAMENQGEYMEDEEQFSAEVYGDTFTFVAMVEDEGRSKVCQGDFCCMVDWKVRNCVL